MNGKVKRRAGAPVPVCSVGGCWEDRAPGSEFCARGPSHGEGTITARCGCGASVVLRERDGWRPGDEERAPIECERCWEQRHRDREVSGATAFTDEGGD